MKRPPARRASSLLAARGVPESLEARLLLSGEPVAADDQYQVVAGQTLAAQGLNDVSLGLVHRWTFDETSGNIAHDSVGGNDGTLFNWGPNEGPWVEGKVGGALAWIDNQDAIVTATGDNLDRITVSFWSYRTGALDNPRIIGPQAGGLIAANIDANLGFGVGNVFAPAQPQLGVWEQYVITVDNIAQQTQIYRNGALVASGSATYTQNGLPWVIGHNQGLDNDRGTWRGLLDDLRIYNRVLSADEAKVLAGKGGDQPKGVLENDLSQSGIPLQASVVQNVAHGTLDLKADGTFTYTPNLGFAGVDTFVYQAIAGGPETDQATVTITVTPAPEAPVAAPDAYTVNQDTQLSALALGDVSQGLMHRWTFDETDGRVAHDSIAGNDGTLFGYQAADDPWVKGRQGGALAWINDSNAVVTLQGDLFSRYTFTFWSYRSSESIHNSRIISPAVTANTEAGKGFGSGNVYDPTLPALGVWEHYSVEIDRVLNTTAVYRDGALVANGPADFNPGTTPWTIGHNGDLGNSADTWRGLLDDLRIYNRLLSVSEVQTLAKQSVGVLANDTDAQHDPLTAVLVDNTTHGALDFHPDGTFTYQPNAGFVGNDSFSYRASDGTHQSDPVTVTIRVANTPAPPVAAPDAYSLPQGGSLTIGKAAEGILANDTDLDGEPLSAALVAAPLHGDLKFHGDGTFTYTPQPEFFGVDKFTYRASDGILKSAVTQVDLTVNRVVPATKANDDAYQVNEGGVLAGASLLLNDQAPDPGPALPIWQTVPGTADLWLAGQVDGTVASISDVAPNQSPVRLLGVPVAADQVLRFSAAVGQVANGPGGVFATADGFNFVQHGKNDGEHGIANLFAPLNSLIGVFLSDATPAGQAPAPLDFRPNTTNVPNGVSYSEVAPSLLQPFFIGDGLASDGTPQQVRVPAGATRLYLGTMDANASFNNLGSFEVLVANLTPVITQAALVQGPSHGQLELHADGTFQYVPAPGFLGADSFQYKLISRYGESNVATATINVNSVAVAPVATDDWFLAERNAPLVSGAVGQSISADAFQDFPASGFGDGTWSYRYSPTLERDGDYALLDVRSNDDFEAVRTGHWSPAAGDVFFRAADQYVWVGANQTGSEMTLGGVHWPANAIAAHPPGTGLVVLSWQAPAAGIAQLDFSFADADPFGAGGVRWYVEQNDSAQTLESGQVPEGGTTGLLHRAGVVVQAGDRLNFIVDPNGEFGGDTTIIRATVHLQVHPGSVLENDSDANLDPLTAAVVDAPAHGQLAFSPDGKFTYTPAAGYAGPDSFTYRASDGALLSNLATVHLTVIAAPLAGDVNGDGKVDLSDFGLLKGSFGQTNANRGQGDLNGDHKVDLSDFGLLKSNFGHQGAASLSATTAAAGDAAWQAAVDWALASLGGQDEAD